MYKIEAMDLALDLWHSADDSHRISIIREKTYFLLNLHEQRAWRYVIPVELVQIIRDDQVKVAVVISRLPLVKRRNISRKIKAP